MRTKRRAGWPAGLRAAISAAIPIVIGSLAKDVSAGLMATIGTFAIRYGNDRPYLNRAVQLAAVVISLAGAVTLGDWVAQIPWAGVLVVSAVAVAAVLLCAVFEVGPPGAYAFVLACAAGAGASGHQPAWRAGLLVLAGGAVAWLVQMTGIVAGFRRLERAAVTDAGEAVAAFIEASESARHDDDRDEARDRAAIALRRAWQILVDYQPIAPRPGSTVDQLRAANHALHLLFARAITTSAGVGAAATARRIAALQTPPETLPDRDPRRPPLRRPETWTALRQALRPQSATQHVMVRVAIAAPLAGTAAALLGVDRAYWAMAAAVLVLHQGLDRARTFERGIARLTGTWLGLGVAAVVLAVHPQGLWLALLIGLLQLTIQVLLPLNYTLAVVFITATALTIASSGRPVDPVHLLITRGVDTAIGCAVGVVVFLAAARFQQWIRLSDAAAEVVDAVAAASAYLTGDVGVTESARQSRRDLQTAVLTMGQAFDASTVGSARDRVHADRLRPTVLTIEQLAYRTIAGCWAAEHPAEFPPRQQNSAADHDRYIATLHGLAAAIRRGETPVLDLTELPAD